ncbi:MAG: hypothetical protein AAGF11_38800 [Myxococcota bacterium]
MATTLEQGTIGGFDPTAAESTSTSDPAPETEPTICEAPCTSLLLSSWTHSGPSGTRSVAEILHEPDGSLVFGLQRTDGQLGLVCLSAEGEPLWSAAPGLPCDDCVLEDIAQHPSGDILLSVTSPASSLPLPPDELPDGPLPPPEDVALGEALLARFDVAEGRLAWTQRTVLRRGPNVQPRATDVVVLDEDRLVQIFVDGSSEEEMIGVLDYRADGTLRQRTVVFDQLGSGEGHSPLVVRGSAGDLVIAHPYWAPEFEQMRAATWRMIPPDYIRLSHIDLPLTPVDLAVDTAGRRVELSQSRGTQSVTLLLTSRASSDPERWSTSLPLVSTSQTRPVLATGPGDAIYAAARTTPRLHPEDPYTVMLEVARWSSAGELQWQAQRPLDMMATDHPLEVVVDDEQGLIVGTVIQGQFHVVRYEHACPCP